MHDISSFHLKSTSWTIGLRPWDLPPLTSRSACGQVLVAWTPLGWKSSPIWRPWCMNEPLEILGGKSSIWTWFTHENHWKPLQWGLPSHVWRYPEGGASQRTCWYHWAGEVFSHVITPWNHRLSYLSLCQELVWSWGYHMIIIVQQMCIAMEHAAPIFVDELLSQICLPRIGWRKLEGRFAGKPRHIIYGKNLLNKSIDCSIATY